ncbi:MAG TPA: PepSY domain-containing protein [Nitrososphaeraceae archaeon]
MKIKRAVGFLAALSCVAISLALVVLPNGSNATAQQQPNNTASNGAMMALMPSGSQQMSNPNSMRMNSANWTSSVSLFSPVIDAIKSKIHTTLNDATTNALKAVGKGSNSSAVAAFIHPERGFLVYNVFVLDSNDNIHRVIVDPGNGKVLSNQPMSLMAMMTMMHPSMGGPGMMGGSGMGMMGHGMMMQHGMMGGSGIMSNNMGMMGGPQNNAWQ